MSGLVFNDVNLSGTKIENANLSNVKISDCRLVGTTIDGIPVVDLFAAYQKMNET